MNLLINSLNVISSILVIVTFIYSIAIPEINKYIQRKKEERKILDMEISEKINDLLKIANNNWSLEIKLLEIFQKLLKFGELNLYPNFSDDKLLIDLLGGINDENRITWPCEFISLQKKASYYEISLINKNLITDKNKNNFCRNSVAKKIKTINKIIEYSNKKRIKGD